MTMPERYSTLVAVHAKLIFQLEKSKMMHPISKVTPQIKPAAIKITSNLKCLKFRTVTARNAYVIKNDVP